MRGTAPWGCWGQAFLETKVALIMPNIPGKSPGALLRAAGSGLQEEGTHPWPPKSTSQGDGGMVALGVTAEQTEAVGSAKV